jgi:hypothetical protein
VDTFSFANWAMVVVLTITLLWPLNIPLMWAACKVQAGGGKLPFDETDDAKPWFRFTFGTLGLAVLSLLTAALAYGLIEGAEMQSSRGTIWMVLLLLYLPVAVAYLFWILALEDLLQALAIFLLYVGLAGLPLALIGWLFSLWKPLAAALPWLLKP